MIDDAEPSRAEPLEPTEILGPQRDASGRWLAGHAPTGGRPRGASNLVGRELREALLNAIGDVGPVVEAVRATQPTALLAALLKLVPQATLADEPPIEGATISEITIVAVPQAWQFSTDAN